MVHALRKSSKRLNARKDTLLRKLYEIAILCDVDVAFVLRKRKTGQIITYKSLDVESWPPSQDEMVGCL